MASTDDSWRPTYDAMFGTAATMKNAEMTKGWDCVVTYSLKELNNYLAVQWPKGHCTYTATATVDEFGFQCQFKLDTFLTKVQFSSQDNGYLDLFLDIAGTCNIVLPQIQNLQVQNLNVGSYSISSGDALLKARIPLSSISASSHPVADLVGLAGKSCLSFVVLPGPPQTPSSQTAFQCPNAGGVIWTLQSLNPTISPAGQDFLDVTGTTLTASLTSTSQPNSVLLSIPAWPLSPQPSPVPGTRQMVDMAACVMTTQHPPQGFTPATPTVDIGILNVWIQTSTSNAGTGDFPAPNSADPILLPQGYNIIVTYSRLAFERTALQAIGAGLILRPDQTNWDMWNEGAGPGSINPTKALRPDKQIRFLPYENGFQFIVAFDTIKWLQERPTGANTNWTTPPLQVIEDMFDDDFSGIRPSTQNEPKVPMSSTTFLCTVSGGTVTWSNPVQRTEQRFNTSTVATDTGPPFIENATLQAMYFPGVPFVNGAGAPGGPATSMPDVRFVSLSCSINATHSSIYLDPSGAPALGISLSPDELTTNVKVVTSLPGSNNSGQLDPLINNMAVRLPQLGMRWPLVCANMFCGPSDSQGFVRVDLNGSKSVQTPWDVFVLGTLDLTHLATLKPIPTVSPSTPDQLQQIVKQLPVPLKSLSIPVRA